MRWVNHLMLRCDRAKRTCHRVCCQPLFIYVEQTRLRVCVACEIVTSTANQWKSKVEAATCRLLWQEIKLTARNVLVSSPQKLPHATHSVPPSRHYSYAPYVIARWLSSGSLCGGLLAQTIDLKPQGLAKVALHLHGQAKMPSTLDPSEFECILNRE